MIGGVLVGGASLEGGAVYEENVGPAVVVIVEDGDAGASGFDDELFGVASPENVRHGEAGFPGDVEKLSQRGGGGLAGRLLRERRGDEAAQKQRHHGERSEIDAGAGVCAEWHALTEILGCRRAGQGGGASSKEVRRLR